VLERFGLLLGGSIKGKGFPHCHERSPRTSGNKHSDDIPTVQLPAGQGTRPQDGDAPLGCSDRGKGVGFVHQGRDRAFPSTVLVQV